MKTVNIRIGHSAYAGANAMALCGSKTEAVETLRSRGLTRDHARAIIQRVCQDPLKHYTTCETPNGDVIEITNLARAEQYCLAA